MVCFKGFRASRFELSTLGVQGAMLSLRGTASHFRIPLSIAKALFIGTLRGVGGGGAGGIIRT